MGRSAKVWGAPTRVGAEAARASYELLSAAMGIELASLNDTLRDGAWFGYWRWAHPETCLESIREGWKHQLYCWLGSMNGNGYVREAAVRQMLRSDSSDDLPFLLLRLNDWVRQIQVAAKEQLARRMRPGAEVDWLKEIELIARMPRWERVEQAQFLQEVAVYLGRSELAEALIEAWRDPRQPTPRVLLPYLENALSDQWPMVIRQAGSSRDVLTRRWAIAMAFKHLPGPQAALALEGLATDRHPTVKLDALRSLLRIDPETALQRLAAVEIFCSSASVRNFARHFLNKHRPGIDYAAEYRGALRGASGARARAALAGLSEVGDPSDYLQTKRFIESESARDVRVGLDAAARLSFEKVQPELQRFLVHPSSSVRLLARRLLRRSLGGAQHQLDLAFFREVLEGSHLDSIRAEVLRFSFRSDAWVCLQLAAQGLRDPSAVVRDAALDLVRLLSSRDLCVRPYRLRKPTEQEAGELQRLLREAESKLDGEILQGLKQGLLFHLGDSTSA